MQRLSPEVGIHIPEHSALYGTVLSHPDILRSAAMDAWQDLEAIYEELHDTPEAGVDRAAAILVAQYAETPLIEPSEDIVVCDLNTLGNDHRTLFARKAAERAHRQTVHGTDDDMIPMEDLHMLDMTKLFTKCGASGSGLHVGVAGPYPNHSRYIATNFVYRVLTNGRNTAYEIPTSPDYKDAGDNGSEFNDFRERFAFVDTLID